VAADECLQLSSLQIFDDLRGVMCFQAENTSFLRLHTIVTHVFWHTSLGSMLLNLLALNVIESVSVSALFIVTEVSRLAFLTGARGRHCDLVGTARERHGLRALCGHVHVRSVEESKSES
jgi:hypothetical protein